jgi:hypothetical protein
MDGVLEQPRAIAHGKEVANLHFREGVAFAPEVALDGRSPIADPARLA